MSIKLGRKAVNIRATDKPLELDQLRAVAPAVFSGQRGLSTVNYQHLSTEDVVRALMTMGYGVSEVGQTRCKRDWQMAEAKHYVRLRMATMFEKTRKEYVPEIVVVNAHNASSKLHLYAGIWRLICANGLMVGETVGQFSYYHRAGVLEEVQQGVATIGKVLLPKVTEQIKVMQGTILNPKRINAFAQAAYALRWEEPNANIQPEHLLASRRPGDEGQDAWRVYNRVQENIIYGNFATGSTRTVQPLSQVKDIVGINRTLWDMAVAA